MTDLGTIRTLFTYSDWANERVLTAAASLADEQLDRDMEIGPGTLRRTFIHTWAGEEVWLRRWMGKVETRWPSEKEPMSVAEIGERFRGTWKDRDAFLAALDPA